MFEAVITLCLSLSDGPCRDHLLPGYEAATEQTCQTALRTDAPDLSAFGALQARGTAFCRPTGEKLSVQEVAPGIFAHVGLIEEPDAGNRGDVTNLGFVIGADSVAVIDTGTARWMGEALWRTIRSRTDKPVSHVILTHMHPDHVLGAAPLAATGAEVVAHDRLTRALADRRANYLESLDRLIGAQAFLGTEIAAVTLPVTGAMEIDIGDRVLALRTWPTAHTGTDLTVQDLNTGVMFTGDLVFHRHTPALDGSLTGWRDVLEEMLAMDITQIVPGHGGPILPWPDGAQAMRQYLATLESDTRAAIDGGERLGDAITHIAESEAALWDLFDAFNPRNATVAFTELEWE